MRLVALASAVLASAYAAVCPANLPPAATPTPTPFPTINPANLCPSACRGWGASYNTGGDWFPYNTATVAGLSPNIMKTQAPLGAVWPAINSSAAGIYSASYWTQDVCGRQASAPAMLDYRCDNPPVPRIRNNQWTQNFNIQIGQEIMLDLSDSYDPDAAETVTIFWCLIQRPSAPNTPYTTQFEDVSSYLRVLPYTGAGTVPNTIGLLKPDNTGTYALSVVVSDGCNYVPQTITVNVNVSCCAHTAMVSGANSVSWNNTAAQSVNTPLSANTAAPNANANCLPFDYVLGKPVATTYKNRFGPVSLDTLGNQVVLDTVPYLAAASVPGCTWAGASNFNALATVDNGLCTCAAATDLWDVQATSYLRRADRTSAAQVIKTSGQIQFVPFLGNSSSTVTNCPKAPWWSYAPLANATDDIRVDTTGTITSTMPYLPRPATSWDATVSYSVSNITQTSYINSNTTTTTYPNGNPICTVAVSTAAATTNTLTVTAGAGYNYQSCLGYYSVLLSSYNAGQSAVCSASQDSLEVAVVCPYPPFVDILCDVNTLLWDGTKFVLNVAANSYPTTSTESFANWVQIDARETPYMPNVAYSLQVSVPSSGGVVPSYYLGAGQTGPAAGYNDLNIAYNTSLIVNPTATGTLQTIAASFLPARGGQCTVPSAATTSTCNPGNYYVSLVANDSCNVPPSMDTVVVSTTCLPITNAATLNTASNTATFSINGNYPVGTTGNLNNGLNFGVRVVSRPQLPLGDIGTVVSTQWDAASSPECMLSPAFKTVWSTSPTGPFASGAQTIAVPLGITGPYSFSVAVLDACSKTELTFSASATCSSSVASVVPSSLTTLIGTWAGGASNTQKGFSQITLPAASTFSGNLQVSWFLTKAPNAAIPIYVAPSPLNATAVTCVGFAATFPAPANSVGASSGGTGIGGVNALRPFNFPTDRSSPMIPVAAQSSPATQQLTQVQMNYLFPATGGYQATFQAVGSCDATTQAANTIVPITMQCNAAAAFMCLSSTGSTIACSGTTVNPTGLSQTTSAWSCAVQRFAPVYINSFASAGPADTSSDDLTVQVTLTAPASPSSPVKESWWTAAYFTETVTFSFSIPDSTTTPGSNADMFDEQNGFVNIKAAIATAFTTAIQTDLALGTGRVFTSNTALNAAVASYAALATTQLGVVITPLCYTAGWGRNFTAAVTYAMLPPTFYQSYGVTTPAAGYSRALTPTDAKSYAPLGQVRAWLAADLYAITQMTVTAAAGTYAGIALTSVVPTETGYAKTPNNILFQTSYQNQGSNAVLTTTSFLPDIDGSFAVNVAIVDDCPGATSVSWSGVPSTVTVSPVQNCINAQQSQLTVSTSDAFTTGALTRTWTNSSAKFHDNWFHSGVVNTPYLIYNAGSANGLSSAFGTTGVCVNTDGTACSGSAPTITAGSNGPNIAFTGAANVDAFATAFIPAGPSGYTGGTLQFTLSTGGTPARGGELRFGCVASFSLASLSAITYFYTIDTNTATGTSFNILMPSECYTGTKTLVLAQFGTPTAANSWTVNTLMLWQHPAGFSTVTASCGLAYAFDYSVVAGQYVPATNTTTGGISAQNVGVVQGITTTNNGYSTNLPQKGSNPTSPAYTLSIVYPTWVMPTPASPLTCSVKSAAAPQVTLTCPANSPTVSVTYRLGASSSTFDPVSKHFIPAVVTVTNIGNTIYYRDVSYTFEVTSAPFGSVLNKQYLADNVLVPRLMKQGQWFTGRNWTTGSPVINYYPVQSQCYNVPNKALFTNPYPLLNSIETLTSQINTTWAAYIDDATLTVMLKSQGGANTLPAWVATPDNNGKFPVFSETINGLASFIPDVAGGIYNVKVAVNDMCNPVAVSTVAVNTAACPTPTPAVITFSPAAPVITLSGAGRVQISATVNGQMWNEDVGSLGVSWTVIGPNNTAIMVNDAQSLYPSFLPPMAGTYTASLTVNWNCFNAGTAASNMKVAPATYTVSQTLTVGCAPTVPLPNPATALALGTTATNVYSRIGQFGKLTVPYKAQGGNANKDVFYWIGEPGCPITNAWWAPISKSNYQCPTQVYSVGVQAVFPPVLLAGIDQIVALTVTINGVAQIPDGLADALYRQGTADPAAIVVKIGVIGSQVTCVNPYVVDASQGHIICHSGALSANLYTAKISVTLDGVSSTDVLADLSVPISNTPVVTGFMPYNAGTLPALGGTRVVITGYNIAFNRAAASATSAAATAAFATTNNWSPADTIVTIDGKLCTGVQQYGSEVLFQSQMSLSCIIPPGQGRNLAVTVLPAFRASSNANQANANIIAVAGLVAGVGDVFTYDAPYVSAPFTASSNNGVGGYWLTVNVTNLGAPVIASPTPTPSPGVVPAYYSDLTVQLGNSVMVPSTSVYVLADESAAGPAVVKFKVPTGCGANLDIRFIRRGSYGMSMMNTFSYGVPMVNCIGQPFIDSTMGACSRVYIEGTNLGNTPGNAISIMFMGSDGVSRVCDDVMVASPHVRLSCRLPAGASPGDSVIVVNECGLSSARSTATLPSSIVLANNNNAFSVSKASQYNAEIQAPLAPATSVRQDATTTVLIQQTGDWGKQVLSNGLFIGLFLPILIILLLAYPIYWRLNRGKQVGGAWSSSGGGSSTPSGAGGDKTVTKGATRVTMNPVSFNAAPAPPVSPAGAPGAVHDNL